MKSMKTVVVILAFGLLQTCQRDKKPDENREEHIPLVTVGDWSLSEESFQSELQRRGLANTSLSEKKAVLDSLVQYQVVLNRAMNDGYDLNPEVINAMKRMMVNKYREDHLGKQYKSLVITDLEVSQYYDSHREDFLLPGKIRGAVILINTSKLQSPTELSKLHEQCEALRAQALTQGSEVFGFGELASEHSDDAVTRSRGGDMGWLLPNKPSHRWSEPIKKQLFKLDKGQISPVFEWDQAFYLLKAVDRQAETYRPLNAVSKTIMKNLFQERKQAIKDEFKKRVYAECNVVKNEKRLNKLWKQFEQEKSVVRGPPSMGSR